MKRFLEHPLYTGGLYLLVRLALFPFAPVPMAVVLDPVWVLLAWRGEAPIGRFLIALLPGMILGDVLSGMPWPLVIFRALGLIAVGLCEPKGGFHTRLAYGTCQFALWSAVVADWCGLYPVAYLFFVWFVQGLLWWGLTAPRQGGGRLRGWASWSWIPLVAGLLFALEHGRSLWPVPTLGNQSALWIRLLTTFLMLLLPGIKVWKLWKGKKGGKTEGKGVVARWSELAE